MRREGFGKRLLSVLLALVMIVGLVPAGILAEVFAAESDPVIVIAGSDFQNTNYDHDAGADQVVSILDQMQADGYTTADGFLFAGDYDYGYDDSAAGKAALQAAVQGQYGTAMDEVYVQGNHDPDSLVTDGTLSASGNNDTENYGVFVINEQDYMWYNNDEATIKETAAELSDYLDAKAAVDYSKPIFVISHLPLHYNMRTKNDGDGMYANYIFDELNAAGAEGLNIIFMFGHNHSNGWDDYLGGAAIYLAKGDSINIAQASKTSFEVETLNFTYMNAGYVAYYRNVNTGSECDLTMTVFEITDTEVVVKRYSESGLHDMKSKGVTNSYKSESGYAPDTNVYCSPQTITLSKFVTGNEVSSNNVSVTAPNLTDVTVTKLIGTGDTAKYDFKIYSAYASYDITPAGYTQGDNASVTITLDAADGFDASKPVMVIDKKENTYVMKQIVNGTVTFTTNHFSAYDVTQTKSVQIEVPVISGGTAGERTYTRITSTSQLVSGGQYLIIENGSTDYFMLPESISNSAGDRVGYNIESTTVAGGDTITGDYSDKEWTMTGSGTSWELSTDAGYAYMEYQSSSRAYGRISSTDSSTFTIGGSADSYTFTTTTNSRNYVFDHSSAGLINGYVKTADTLFYIYRLTSTGSSAPTVETSGGSWVEITAPVAGTSSYTYQLDTNGVDADTAYLIVNARSAVALENNGTSGLTTTAISISGTTATTSSEDYEWKIDSSKRIYTTINGTTYYLRASSSWGNASLSLTTSSSNATQWSISNNNGAYTISTSLGSFVSRTYYLTTSGISTSSGTVRLFAKDGSNVTDGTDGLYGKLVGSLGYNVASGTSAENALAAVKAGITVYYINAASKPGSSVTGTLIDDDDADMKWVLDESYGDGTTPGEYAVTISYKGVVLGIAKVVVPETDNTQTLNVAIDSSSGTVKQNAASGVQTGSVITVTDENGNVVDTVKVTVGMLKNTDGTAVSTANVGTLTGLDVYYTYNGVQYKVFENYTLNVVAPNNYPEYPNEGAVKVSKTATGIDFQSSGVAKVELSVSGVPTQKGADVVIVIDTSSSMSGNEVGSTGKTRIEVLSESLEQMLTQFQQVNDNGMVPDVSVAIIDFNGYFESSAGDFDEISLNGTNRTNVDYARVFTGSNAGQYIKETTLSANDFVSAESIDTATVAGMFTNENCASGTNYDGALENAYNLLAAKQAANEEEREAYVIFLSDGAPFRYNGFNNGSEQTTYPLWNQWLTGAWATEDEVKDAITTNTYDEYSYFYNGDGTVHPHRYAEAIKGSTTASYSVIDRTMSSADPAYMKQVPGLGATLYAIGFGLADDGSGTNIVSVDTMMELIQVISSGEGYYYPNVQSKEELTDAFNHIVTEIAYAATNAYFLDQMGTYFDMQMATVQYAPEGSTEKTESIAPYIEVKAYDIITRQDYLNSNGTILESQIGDRKGTYTVLETVTFNADGTAAYSSLIDVDGDGTYGVTGSNGSYTIDEGDNILGEDGVIHAKNFAYNTTSAAVVVNGITVEAESFYWYVGTVTTTELALSYYVYLTGSMEGTRDDGSYATNNYATLYYENYLGNDCHKDTISPTLAWESALVRYAFYLVNANGQPVNANGDVVPFANKVAVTQPVVYQEILLNNLDNVNSIEVASLGTLPDGYTLYDTGAVYTVTINSNSTGSWEIKNSQSVATTYVMDFSDTVQYSNALIESSSAYDYTHTTVWFAVVWTPQCIADTVVIDFGLPVDIHVLTNDMFGDYGQLVGVTVGTVTGSATGDASNQVTGTAADGSFGTAQVVTTDSSGAALGKNQQVITYTPNTMAMNGVDTFTYSVYYSGSANAGYYYGTVTVIPATTVYYEDSFVNYTNSGKSDGTYGTWTDAGAALSGNQDEDRPGKYSLSIVDANNIYGFDSVYGTCGEFSMGGAKKVTVKSGVSGMASFTFWGTGFDVISMTDTTTGMIIVNVYDANEALVKSLTVNNYFGYAYQDGEWVAVDSNDPNALYQVPVMKVDGLEYGQYTVKIVANYNSLSDVTENGSYDFYLDAIRIYDPAGTTYDVKDSEGNVTSEGNIDDVIQDAYIADGEGWPSYTELRNNVVDTNGFKINDDGKVSFPNDNVTGAIFIDSDDNNASISDYVSYGPNNELYLASGQSVAFQLDQTYASMIADVQIALKVGNGGSVTYEIYNAADDGTKTNTKSGTLNTATDLYYSIKDLASGTIVITNSGESGILSITNIKVTYTEDPSATPSTASLLWMDEVGATAALMSLRSTGENESEDVETEVPEESTGLEETETPEVEENEPDIEESTPETPEVSEPETEEEPETPEVEEPEVEENEPETPEVGENESEETEPESFFDKIGNFFKKLFGWLFG